MCSRHTHTHTRRTRSRREIIFPENHLAFSLNMPRVSPSPCVIPSPMTESKIGHPCSARDVTPGGLIGADWRRPRHIKSNCINMRTFFLKMPPPPPSVCHFSFKRKISFICLSIWDGWMDGWLFPHKQPPQMVFRRPPPPRAHRDGLSLRRRRSQRTSSSPGGKTAQLLFR